MDDDNYKQITDAYKQCSNLFLNNQDVMKNLIGILIVNIKHAKNTHAENKFETMVGYNNKSLFILSHIRISLQDNMLATDETSVLQLAAYMRHLYQNIYIRLTNILLNNEPQKEFDYFISVLREQYSILANPLNEGRDISNLNWFSNSETEAESTVSGGDDSAKQESTEINVSQSAEQDLYV